MSPSLGRYALIKLIGRGGMAEVWTGKAYGASGFEKVVAIKLLSKNLIDDELYQRALTDEALLQVTLKHPNIVDIYDLNIEGETPYLVMEYVEGLELRDILQTLRKENKALDFPIAAAIVFEVSKALSYAHERNHEETGAPLGIVHRDISPSNILISAHGEVKLSDFGIAKSSLQSGVTQIGQIKGKFRYMSPEQATGDTIDSRSDIYSLGLVFYECLFGEPAYGSLSDAVLLRMAQTGQVRLPEETPQDLKRIFAKLLATDPESRYQELNSFRSDLMTFAESKGGLGTQEEIKKYLHKLELPELQRMIRARKEAADSELLPSSPILDQTGRLLTVAHRLSKRRKRIFAGLGFAGIALIAAVTVTISRVRHPLDKGKGAPTVQVAPIRSGKLVIGSNPSEALIELRYGKTSLVQPSPASVENLPFNVPIAMKISKTGFETVSREEILNADSPEKSLNIPLVKIERIQVRFLATPYAEGSIPGEFQQLETPFERSLPPGNYEVTFFHELSGRQVTAKINGLQGGSFTCSADMLLEKPTVSPKATCRKD